MLGIALAARRNDPPGGVVEALVDFHPPRALLPGDAQRAADGGENGVAG